MLVMGHAFARRLKANQRRVSTDGPRTPDASGALAGLRSHCSWRSRQRHSRIDSKGVKRRRRACFPVEFCLCSTKC